MSTPSSSASLTKLMWGLKQVWEAMTTDPLATPLSVFFGSRIALYILVLFLAGFFPGKPGEKPNFIAALYYARLGKWHLAIPLAVLTTLTRLAGLAILLPLAYEYLRQRGLRPQALLLGVIATGIAGFAVYMWVLTGNPLSFLLAHKAWYRTLGLPWKPLVMGFERLTWPLGQYVTAIAIVDFASIVLFLGLTLLVFKYLPATYWLYCISMLFISLSTTIDPTKAPPTGSIPRSLMALFPCFMVLGTIGKNRYLDQAIMATFAILLGVISIHFFSRFWVL